MGVRRIIGIGASAFVLVAATAMPAGAQQLIDAGGENGEGGLAFVALTVMVLVMVGAMFFMDKVRRRANERDESRN